MKNMIFPSISFFFLSLMVLVSACSTVSTKPPEELIKLTVNTLPYMSFVPLEIAEKEGYFAEQGIEVEFVSLGSDAEVVVALSQGELDVSAGFITVGMINAISQGKNIKFVADKGYIAPSGCTVNALVARRSLVDEGELESPSQLEGRIIAMDPPTIEGYVVERLLKEVGLSLDDIETTDMPPPAELDAFESGSIDLTSTSEPWVTRLLHAGFSTVWMPFEEIVPDFQYAVIMFGDSLLEEDRNAGNRFMTAYLQAIRQYNQGKTEQNMALMQEYTEEERDFLEEVCWPTFRSDGYINTQSILDFQNWSFEKGYLENKIRVEQFWDPEFVKNANEALN